MSTLDELRLSITERQRELLGPIWDYYSGHQHQWMPSRVLHQQWGGFSIVRPELEKLGGAIVWDDNWNPSDGGSRYTLSLTGVLLTREGADIERLIQACLTYLVARFYRDPLFKQVTRADLEADAGVSREESALLGHVLALSSSWWLHHGGGGDDNWSFAPPQDIDAIADRLIHDVPSFVLEHVLDEFEYFGHSVSIDGRKRSEQISQRQRQPASPGVFDFVANHRLREMVTDDWQEANRVYGVEGWKSTILLCGGVLEGLLLYVLKRRKKRASAAYRQVFPTGKASERA